MMRTKDRVQRLEERLGKLQSKVEMLELQSRIFADGFSESIYDTIPRVSITNDPRAVLLRDVLLQVINHLGLVIKVTPPVGRLIMLLKKED